MCGPIMINLLTRKEHDWLIEYEAAFMREHFPRMKKDWCLVGCILHSQEDYSQLKSKIKTREQSVKSSIGA